MIETRQRKWSRGVTAFLLAGFFGALPLERASAVTESWLVLSGSWNTKGNWSGGSVPGSGVDAVINNGGTVLASAATSGTARDLTLGDSGTGTLVISGGLISDTNGFIGYRPGSTGQATVSSGTWANASTLVIGNSGTGTLNLSGGAVACATGYIGSNGDGTGAATVSGGTWNAQALHVGEYGKGTLNLESAGVLSIGNGSGDLKLAVNADSVGILNLGTGGMAGTLMASSVTGGAGTATVNFNHTGSYTFAPQLAGTLNVNKLGTGTTILTGSHSYTGATTVFAGNLVVNGALAATSGVSVRIGAVLSGSGSVNAAVAVEGTINGTLTTGTLSGAGLVSPGNGTGMLTAAALDVSGGVDFAFEFTLPGTNPITSEAAANGSDLLLLTGASPFTGDLTADNVIGIYLENAVLGATYWGGFFAQLSAADLECIIENAQFAFFARDEVHGTVTFNGKKYVSLNRTLIKLGTADIVNATFRNGITEGSELKIAVVPEPEAWLLGMAGASLLALTRSRFRRPTKM